MAANVRTLRVVIYNGQLKQELLDKIKARHENMQVFSLDEVRKLGQGTTSKDLNARRPSPRTTTSRASCMMVAAKGVVITHCLARRDLPAAPGAWTP